MCRRQGDGTSPQFVDREVLAGSACGTPEFYLPVEDAMAALSVPLPDNWTTARTNCTPSDLRRRSLTSAVPTVPPRRSRRQWFGHPPPRSSVFQPSQCPPASSAVAGLASLDPFAALLANTRSHRRPATGATPVRDLASGTGRRLPRRRCQTASRRRRRRRRRGCRGGWRGRWGVRCSDLVGVRFFSSCAACSSTGSRRAGSQGITSGTSRTRSGGLSQSRRFSSSSRAAAPMASRCSHCCGVRTSSGVLSGHGKGTVSNVVVGV